VKPAWLTALQEVDLSREIGRGASATMVEGRWKMDGDGASTAPYPTSGTEPTDFDANATLLRLLASPEIASKRVVYRQYDHQVGTNTVVGPGSDAAVIRIKGTNKAIAVATDGNAAYTFLDPYTGGAIAVAEAARNVACTGAKPIAMTNCLNFGNPEKPEVYYQLKEAIRGMADAARALDIPVVSGNVSLYNETNGEAIWPTPVVGVVGLIEDVTKVVPMGFQRDGDVVLLVGTFRPVNDGLAGAEYTAATIASVAGKPRIDLAAERALQSFLIAAAERGLLKSAHDVGAGGLAVALAECCLAGNIGVEARGLGGRVIAGMYGEAQSGAVVSCADGDFDALHEVAKMSGVEVQIYGTVGRSRFRCFVTALPLDDLRAAYESGLAHALEGVVANV
jgi:phosphoribosylformylglycinamidine synthase